MSEKRKAEDTRINTEKVKKAKVTLLLDKNLYEKAHSLGINVSKASENVLKELISAIEGRKSFLAPDSFPERSGMVLRPGFGPGSATREAAIHSPLIRRLSKV